MSDLPSGAHGTAVGPVAPNVAGELLWVPATVRSERELFVAIIGGELTFKRVIPLVPKRRPWFCPVVLLLGALCFSGCAPLRPGYEGINVFPIFRYATEADGPGVEWQVLWPLLQYRAEARELPGRAAAESVAREFALFPLYYQRHEPALTYDEDEYQITVLWGRGRRTSRVTGEMIASHWSLVPFIIDDVVRFESGHGGPDSFRLRILWQDWSQSPERSELRLFDLVRQVPLASLFTYSSTNSSSPFAEPLTGREWTLLEILGFRGMRSSSHGAYRDFEFLSLPVAEDGSWFRRQIRKDGSAGSGHFFPFGSWDFDETGTEFCWFHLFCHQGDVSTPAASDRTP